MASSLFSSLPPDHPDSRTPECTQAVRKAPLSRLRVGPLPRNPLGAGTPEEWGGKRRGGRRGAEGDRGEGEGRGGRKPRLQDGSLAVLGCSGSGPGRGPPGRGGGRVRNQQKREGRPQVPETRQEEAWKAHKKQVKRPGSRSQAGSAGSGQPGCPGGKAEPRAAALCSPAGPLLLWGRKGAHSLRMLMLVRGELW